MKIITLGDNLIVGKKYRLVSLADGDAHKGTSYYNRLKNVALKYVCDMCGAGRFKLPHGFGIDEITILDGAQFTPVEEESGLSDFAKSIYKLWNSVPPYTEIEAGIRQKALRGEWDMAWLGGATPMAVWSWHDGHQYRYFPTEELRDEYKLIAKGEWVPKEGDEYVSFGRYNNDPTPRPGIWHWGFAAPGFVYFPSVKQAEEFLKNRKRLPTAAELRAEWSRSASEEKR